MTQLAFPLTEKYGGTIGTTTGTPLGQLITNVVDAAIALGGILAIFLFIIGGYQILSAAGSDDPKRQSQGTQTLTYAIIGFIIVFASYWIIRLIETLLGADIISTNPLQ
jgi:hypothetical protein